MRKKQIIQSVVFVTLFVLISTQGNTQTSKIFVGYIDNYPVFDSYKEKKVYIFKDTIKELFDYPKSYSLVAINNNFKLYSENRTKENIDIILCMDNIEKRYSVNTGGAFIVLDKNGTVFFTDRKQSIKCIINDEIKDTGLKGYCLDIVEGVLYYSIEHNPDVIYPDMDIFEINIKTLKNPRKILANVLGDGNGSTLILSGGNYIYDYKLMDGGFQPILYDVEKEIYKRVFVEEKPSLGYFYSFQEDALIFYNYETLEFQIVDIYDGW